MVAVFRLTVFFALAGSVFAAGTLDALVNAAEGFALAIQQQIAIVQSVTTPPELAAKTISYAAAKTTYYEALRAGGAGIDGHCDRQETATAGSRPVCPSVFGRGRKAGKGRGRSNG